MTDEACSKTYRLRNRSLLIRRHSRHLPQLRSYRRNFQRVHGEGLSCSLGTSQGAVLRKLPSPISRKICSFFGKPIAFRHGLWYNIPCSKERPVGQAAKTTPSHGVNRSSILLRVSSRHTQNRLMCLLFFCLRQNLHGAGSFFLFPEEARFPPDTARQMPSSPVPSADYPCR